MTSYLISNNFNNNEVCPICITNNDTPTVAHRHIEKQDEKVHKIHLKCLNRAAKVNPKCPLCRTEIDLSSIPKPYHFQDERVPQGYASLTSLVKTEIDTDEESDEEIEYIDKENKVENIQTKDSILESFGLAAIILGSIISVLS